MLAFYSIGSLFLGLIAWGIPFLGINRYYKGDSKKNFFRFSLLSFSACIASLCFQFFEIQYRVKLQDWSALLDTTDSLIRVVLILVIVTILINLFTFSLSREEKDTDA